MNPQEPPPRRTAWIAFAAAALATLAVFHGPAFDAHTLPHDVVQADDVPLVGTVLARAAAQVRSGTLPLWFPEFACGTPVAAGWMYGLLYPGLALFLVLPVGAAFAWTAALHAGLGAAGMERFLRGRGCGVAGAFAGAFVFALSDFAVGQAACGHVNLVLPLCWAPWVLRFADGCVRGERRAVPLLGLALGAGLLSGHVQMWLYLAPLVAAAAIREVVALPADARRAAVVRLGAGTGLAAAIALPQIVLTLGFLAQAAAPLPDAEQMLNVSMPPATLAAKLVTGRLGWEAMPQQAIDFRHEHRWLAGALTFGLAAWGVVRRAPRRWLWVTAAAVGLFASVGLHTAASRWLGELPGFALSRAPARAAVVALVAVSVLAAHGADALAALLRGRASIAVPCVAAAHALLNGFAWPLSTHDAAFARDWTSELPPETSAHRVDVSAAESLAGFELSGLRTMRAPVYVIHAGFRRFLDSANEHTPYWLDLAGRADPVWARMPFVDGPLWASEDLRGFRTLRLAPMGAARLFDTAEPSVEDDEALRRLATGERALFLAEPAPGRSPARDAKTPSQVAAIPSSADELRFAVSSPGEAWLFVSIRHDTAWRASVNGTDLPLLRANVAFVAVAVPAGRSDVLLRYRPPGVPQAGIVTALALVGCVVLLLRPVRAPDA